MASLLLYAPTLNFDFIAFDDQTIILEHPKLFNEDSFVASLHEIFVGYLPREEPLLIRDVSWAINARLFGFENPFGYHLGNVLLNAFVPGLLAWFLWLITRRATFSIIVAAAYAMLAVRAEAVAWVMGRKDVLTAVFFFTALIADHYAARKTGAARLALWSLGLGLTVLAALSKISSITLPGLMILLAFLERHVNGTVLPRSSVDFGAGLRRAVWYLPHLVVCLVILRWYNGVLDQWGVFVAGYDNASWDHAYAVLTIMPTVFARYFYSIFVPNQLSLWYETPSLNVLRTPLELGWALVFWPGTLLVSIALWLRRKDLLFYWLGFFGLMVPYLGLKYVGFWMANRYLYISAFCIVAIAVQALWDLVPKLDSRPIRIALITGAAGLALLNLSQAAMHQLVFKNNETVWSYEAELDPPSMRALQAVADVYLEMAFKAPRDAREPMLELADKAIERGVRHYETLDLLREQGTEGWHMALLLRDRGKLAEARGEPPVVLLKHYLAAYRRMPGTTFAFEVAEAYRQLALDSSGPERKDYVLRALFYFDRYCWSVSNDPVKRAHVIGLLDRYYEPHFESVRPQIQSIRKRYSGPNPPPAPPQPGS